MGGLCTRGDAKGPAAAALEKAATAREQAAAAHDAVVNAAAAAYDAAAEAAAAATQEAAAAAAAHMADKEAAAILEDVQKKRQLSNEKEAAAEQAAAADAAEDRAAAALSQDAPVPHDDPQQQQQQQEGAAAAAAEAATAVAAASSAAAQADASSAPPRFPSGQLSQQQQQQHQLLQQHQQLLLEAARAQQHLSPSVSSPVCYLFYAPDYNGGSLLQQWAAAPIAATDIAARRLVLLASFIPGSQRNVPKSKFTVNGGITVLIQEVKYRWDTWSKSQKQNYYLCYLRFIKVADELDAALIMYPFSAPPPVVKVFFLEPAPAQNVNQVVAMRKEVEVQLSPFLMAAVVPPVPVYKEGAALSLKRFGDIATDCGGAYLHLARRLSEGRQLRKWVESEGDQKETRRKETGGKETPPRQDTDRKETERKETGRSELGQASVSLASIKEKPSNPGSVATDGDNAPAN